MQGTTGAIQCAMHMTDGLIHNKPNLLEVWDKGCVELYEELGQYAERCNELFHTKFAANDYNAPGVYDYEVSCEFGEWFGRYILANNGDAPTSSEAISKLEELADQFFKQAEEFSNRHKEN